MFKENTHLGIWTETYDYHWGIRIWVLEFCLESVRAWWSYGRGRKERKTGTEAVVWMCYVHTSRWVHHPCKDVCNQRRALRIFLYCPLSYCPEIRCLTKLEVHWRFFVVFFLNHCSLCLLVCLFLLGWPESSRNLPVSSLQFWGFRHAQPCSDFSMSPGNLNSGHYPCRPSSVIHWATPPQPHSPSFKRAHISYTFYWTSLHTQQDADIHMWSPSAPERCASGPAPKELQQLHLIISCKLQVAMVLPTPQWHTASFLYY